jgi:hypothetical protein
MNHARFKELVLTAVDAITSKYTDGEPPPDLAFNHVDQPLGDWLDDLEDAIHKDQLTPAEVEEECGTAEDDDDDFDDLDDEFDVATKRG